MASAPKKTAASGSSRPRRTSASHIGRRLLSPDAEVMEKLLPALTMKKRKKSKLELKRKAAKLEKQAKEAAKRQKRAEAAKAASAAAKKSGRAARGAKKSTAKALKRPTRSAGSAPKPVAERKATGAAKTKQKGSEAVAEAAAQAPASPPPPPCARSGGEAPVSEADPEEVQQRINHKKLERINNALREQAVMGHYQGNDVDLCVAGSTLDAFTGDPLMYPQIPFFEEYSEARRVQAVSEDEMLRNAHQYFSALNKKESLRNQAAVRRLQQMKRINRMGGDKDGFRYVLPKDVRTVVHQLKQAEGEGEANVDPDKLSSTFGGDGVQETAAKPMRSLKKRNKYFGDFYQFQVSKKWTRNAENFLSRSRGTRAMFAAKKQQRSIKKM